MQCEECPKNAPEVYPYYVGRPCEKNAKRLCVACAEAMSAAGAKLSPDPGRLRQKLIHPSRIELTRGASESRSAALGDAQ